VFCNELRKSASLLYKMEDKRKITIAIIGAKGAEKSTLAADLLIPHLSPE
jgi:ABC-type antimicrobial peptide transport system ATPase subunit